MLANDRLDELSTMATRMQRFVRRTNPPRHAACTAAHATLRRGTVHAKPPCVLLSRCAELPLSANERMGGAGRQPSDAGRRAAKAESCPSKRATMARRRRSRIGLGPAPLLQRRCSQPQTGVARNARVTTGWRRASGQRAPRRSLQPCSKPLSHQASAALRGGGASVMRHGDVGLAGAA